MSPSDSEEAAHALGWDPGQALSGEPVWARPASTWVRAAILGKAIPPCPSDEHMGPRYLVQLSAEAGGRTESLRWPDIRPRFENE